MTCRGFSFRLRNVTRAAVTQNAPRCKYSVAASKQQPLDTQHVRKANSPIFQRLLALHKQPTGWTPPASLLVEGRTLILHLASSPWRLTHLILTEHTLQKELERQSNNEPHLLQPLSSPFPPRSSSSRTGYLLQFSPRQLDRLSHTRTPSHYLAEFTIPSNPAALLPPLQTFADAVVLDGVSDPTNVASLLRSAHAFGFHRVVLRQGSCSPYNHKVVAGSAGSIAYVHTRRWDEQLESTLMARRAQGKVCVVGLVAAGGRPLSVVAEEVRRRRAEGASVWLVVGNESRGLSDAVTGSDLSGSLASAAP